MIKNNQSDTEQKIIRFLHKEKILSLSTLSHQQPWSATCFFALDSNTMTLIIQSSLDSRHIREALDNTSISGTVYHNPGKIGHIQGIQFEAIFIKPEGFEEERIKRIYLRKFPFASLHEGESFVIKLLTVKMTDNKLGFGTKLNWVRS